MARGRWQLSLLLTVLAACGEDPSDASEPEGTTGLGPSGTSEPGSGSSSESGGTSSQDGSSTGLSSGTAADESSGGESTGTPPGPPYEPIRYPSGRVHSPVTAYVADQWRAYAEASAEAFEDVFFKAGASSTVSPNTLFCFETNDSTELGLHDGLAPALAFFRGGDAGGTNPFGRTSLAAESGRSAAWVTDGDPSPLEQEWDAITPRLGLVHFGTNDMNLGATHGSAMVPFYDAMMTLVDEALERGTLPVLFGITRRGDSPTAELWVESYNAMIRGVAQSRQLPFIDLYEAIDPLPEHGLSGDGLHLQTFGGGACRLTEEGLLWGYNMRNLVALEGLHRAMAVLVDDVEDLDEDAPIFVGEGTLEDPVRIDAFPFAHTGDTSRSTTQEIDAYPPCDDADESGPEIRYRVELDAPTALRVLVLDRPEVDVDIHILEANGDGDTCVARGDRRIEGELPAGTWDIVVDTWSDGGDTFVGEYLFVVLPCQPGDEACAGAL
ncbi:MAG: SGNH/GDSL hydrolase family protein [Nannocystaceae bacterium]|nr:SGNH/GDSL hydrolase family protein [Nannocystaceae bacterium]